MFSAILSDLVVDNYNKCHPIKKYFQITVNTYTGTMMHLYKREE